MDDILKTEYSREFDRKRMNAVLTSYYKYGSARQNFGGGRVDAIKSAEACIEAFKKDKNTEHLVDAANYLMFRFMYPYDGEKYAPTDDSRSVKPVGDPIGLE